MNKESIEWIVKRFVDTDDDVTQDSGTSAKKRRIEVITIDDSPAHKVKAAKRTIPSPQQQKQELEPESGPEPLPIPLPLQEQQKQQQEEEPEPQPELAAICSKQTQTDLIVSLKRVSVSSQTENLTDSPAIESAAASSSVEKPSPKVSPNNNAKMASKENSKKRANYSKSTNRAKARIKDSSLAMSCRSIQSRAALNFECISDPNNKMTVNSAGERFNAEYYIRNLYRKQLLNALTNGNVPQGASNPIATAQRIEARIFKEFKSCSKQYRNHTTERSGFLNDSDSRELRLNVVMGRIKPEQYAFMPIDDMDHQKMVELRIATKEAERASSVRDL